MELIDDNRTAYNRKKRFLTAHGEHARDKDKERLYLSKKFIPVDGEGVTIRHGKDAGKHYYVLLAVGDHTPITSPTGLTTSQCLAYLMETCHDGIPVIYGGGYDFNCWMKDIPENYLQRLYDGERIQYGGYRIQWRMRKWMRISKAHRHITIYDIVSFFQRPFIDACDEYLGDYEGRDILVKEKARRAVFTLTELTTITDYNNLELRLLTQLAAELRARLNKVHLRPRTWIGPGSIASALFTRENIPAHMTRDIPADVLHAIRCAYAGGRFECLQYGISNDRAYENDLNSAYPKALTLVPSLAGGTWEHHGKGYRGSPDGFTLYRVRWNVPKKYSHLPGPFFVRADNGTVSYPSSGGNWIWTPEYNNIHAYKEAMPGTTISVMEAWEFHPVSNVKPFAFLEHLYNQRAALKRAHDGAQVALKLAVNSAYGKTAQQVGWDKKTRQPPKYHQLAWAGYTTSWCRAQVLRAALQAPETVIAFETDALFTTKPLDLPQSDRLGEWKESVFTSLTYIQSGHYYGTEADGTPVAKMRGVDRGELHRESVEHAMVETGTIQARLTRFTTLGIALAQGLEKWRRWETLVKNLELRPSGKRIPINEMLPGWNATTCPIRGAISVPYPVEWEENTPSELTRLRNIQYDEGYGNY